MAEQSQTERDTLAAKARLNTNNSTTPTSAEARVDTQRAQSRTKGGTGFDKLQRRIAAQENPQQQETLFTELQTPMTQHYFPVGTGGGGGAIFPFQIVRIDDTTIAIRKGTVNNIVPTIGGTALDDDYTQNTITVGSATTFWLSAVLVDEEITAVAIVTSDPGADTATATKQTLGSLTWDSGAIDAISSNLGGSQNVDSCGASHSWNRI